MLPVIAAVIGFGALALAGKTDSDTDGDVLGARKGWDKAAYRRQGRWAAWAYWSGNEPGLPPKGGWQRAAWMQGWKAGKAKWQHAFGALPWATMGRAGFGTQAPPPQGGYTPWWAAPAYPTHLRPIPYQQPRPGYLPAPWQQSQQVPWQAQPQWYAATQRGYAAPQQWRPPQPAHWSHPQQAQAPQAQAPGYTLCDERGCRRIPYTY